MLRDSWPVKKFLREPWRFWNHSEQDTNGTLFLRIVFNADNLNILPYRQRAMNTRTQMFFCEDRKAWCEHEMKDPPWHANHEKYSFKSAACVMPFVPHVFQLILKSKQIFRPRSIKLLLVRKTNTSLLDRLSAKISLNKEPKSFSRGNVWMQEVVWGRHLSVSPKSIWQEWGRKPPGDEVRPRELVHCSAEFGNSLGQWKNQVTIKLRRKKRAFYSSQTKDYIPGNRSGKLQELLHWSGVRHAVSYTFETKKLWTISTVYIVQSRFLGVFSQLCMHDKPLVLYTLVWDGKEID